VNTVEAGANASDSDTLRIVGWLAFEAKTSAGERCGRLGSNLSRRWADQRSKQTHPGGPR
jgi:hypothetical protein